MSLPALTAAIAAQLEQQLTPGIPELQVTDRMNFNPTPPAVDLYPADPFQEQDAYGPLVSRDAFFTIRARVSTADQDGGQTQLLELMDASSSYSVIAALVSDPQFSGNCQNSLLEGQSGYIVYVDPGGQGNNLLGAEWRLRIILQ